MITTKFTIEPYLAEYLRGKWSVSDANGNPADIISIPDKIYLYNILSSLTIKRPKHAPLPDGNLEVILPHRKEGNKNPEYYNYISAKSAMYFNKKVKLFFRADLHEFIDSRKHDEGETYKDACYYFISKYRIESIDPDSLAKNYYRWKSMVRENREKKAYATR
ncbi:MAG: hypothetical protein LBR26_13410 [Prevotella sp.]|jgi:hypothetical protein|nr:hypothetical protein [Prevotella sp.]